MKENKDQQIQIELTEEVAQGTYSNLAVISHSSSDFVIDFIRVVPGVPKAKVKSRIILTPEHAKRLLHALTENVERFEKQYEQIKVSNQDGFILPINGAIGEA